ncbi:MAG: hypothetical protein OXB92_12470 [Acidimicrobiaceae bacterium]|nr:hypothetical protein [Acidimicrobiia bacterium]MCY4494661.1 hypothetical protein [Acidimicrobiaceae bacterium]
MARGGTFGGIFIDENILGVAYELDSLHPGLVYWVGHPAILEIPPSTKDTDLLDALGSGNLDLIFVTRDKRIRRDRIEREHLMRSAVRAVFLTSAKNMNKSQMAALIEQSWDQIAQEVGLSSGPSLWSLTPSNGLKPIN